MVYTGKEKEDKLGSINEPNDHRNRAVMMLFVVGAGGMPRCVWMWGEHVAVTRGVKQLFAEL